MTMMTIMFMKVMTMTIITLRACDARALFFGGAAGTGWATAAPACAGLIAIGIGEAGTARHGR
jgi:hypothetical protein